MKGIFLPNGVGSLKIINQLAKKEFGNEIGTANSYVELKRDIIKVLRKKTARELEENKLATLVNIKSIEEIKLFSYVCCGYVCKYNLYMDSTSTKYAERFKKVKKDINNIILVGN